MFTRSRFDFVSNNISNSEFDNGIGYVYYAVKLPGGEMHVTLPKGSDLRHGQNVSLVAKLKSPEDMVSFIIMLNFLRKYKLKQIFIPYLPFGRQDREQIDNNGSITLFSCKAIWNTIDLLIRDVEIYTLDSHSNIPHGLFLNNNLVDISDKRYSPISEDKRSNISVIHMSFIDSILTCMCGKIKSIVLVSPDFGAYKKTEQYLNNLKGMYPSLDMSMLTLGKTREVTTGNIVVNKVISSTKELVFNNNVMYLILDDICDGGATFLSAAAMLDLLADGRPCNKALFTTHAMYSKGTDLLSQTFMAVGTTDSWYTPTDSLPRNFQVQRLVVLD